MDTFSFCGAHPLRELGDLLLHVAFCHPGLGGLVVLWSVVLWSVVLWSVVLWFLFPARFRHTCGTLGGLKNTSKSALGTLVRLFFTPLILILLNPRLPPVWKRRNLRLLPVTPGRQSKKQNQPEVTGTNRDHPGPNYFFPSSILYQAIGRLLHVAFCSPGVVPLASESV
jgi:hypothetical protein